MFNDSIIIVATPFRTQEEKCTNDGKRKAQVEYKKDKKKRKYLHKEKKTRGNDQLHAALSNNGFENLISS